MKSMRKTTCILLALIMITAMATTVFAEGTTNKITINGAKTGETYSAYKMLDLSVDVANSAYSYTVNSAWTAFFADTETAAWKTVFQKDSQGYVTAKDGIEDETAWNATSNLSKFAEAAAAFAKGLTATASETASDESVELTTSEPGYYLVTSTLGTRAMIDTTPGDVTMTEKNAVSSIEKTVKEDSNSTYGTSNDAQIGDTVEFMSTATIVPRSVGNKIHDTMSSGLTFDTNSIKIYTNEALTTELATGYYTIQGTPDNGDTFTIVIKDTFAATATAEQKLYITYTATLNEKAAVTTTGEGEAATTTPAITDQTNITHISTGNATISQTATTTTTTHKFSVFKHAKDSQSNLAGAVFSLKKASATDSNTKVVVPLIKIDDKNYRVAKTGENGENTFTTVSSGDIVIWGVDADGDYSLEETAAPEGYNKLAEEKPVTVDAGNGTRIEVENMAGAELPSTGGIGTTLFYVAGGLMMLAAVVLLVTKKRMSVEE